MQQQQNQTESQKNEKIGLVLFGSAQTGKSSTINQLKGQYICEQGSYGRGLSCTQNSELYEFTTQGGQQVIAIDTQGFNGNSIQELKENQKKNASKTYIQEVLVSHAEQLIEKGVTKLYFLLTERLSDGQAQIFRNIHDLYQIFGETAIKSCLILATQYIPEQICQKKVQQKVRMDTIKQYQKTLYDDKNIFLPIQTFQTTIFDQFGKPQEVDQIPIVSPDESQKQENELFSQLDKLKSYPVKIFQEYNEFCQQRIEELYNTNGIGVLKSDEITYEKQIIETVQQVSTQNPIKNILGIKKAKTIQETKLIPIVKQKQSRIKNKEEIYDMYMNDQQGKYSQERQEKLNQLFNQYDQLKL